RTPMNGILGFAGLLKDPNMSPDMFNSYIDIIEQSGERMLNLIDDLVEISKIEANQVQIDPNETRLNHMVDRIYHKFKSQAENLGLALTCEKGIADSEVEIFIDDIKLEIILNNLLKNALKFTKKGSIHFKYKIDDNHIIFSIKDTGIGIPPGMEEVIFERFRQVEYTYLRETEGSGLGLTISKSFAEKMNGKIWVESVLDEGSEFFVKLPFEELNNQVTESFATTEDVFKDEIIILIAEDDELSYIFFEQLFVDHNFKLLHAKNGHQTIQLLEENQGIEVILMDLKMPDMNGVEATTEIRKTNPTIPIIAQTAYASEADKKTAFNAGCSDFITKPIKKDILLEKIELAIKKYRK
ncbi:MAG: hybrid sensor histidine kinase/response regulator, partial [Bacteroidales bacterium]|nr:hybrid sensor histidine kinase/response regulator [Bacteroidales bacterium]